MPRDPATTVRVVPNVAGLTKEFDYSVPTSMASAIDVGALVRIELNGRRVAGWVIAIDPIVDEAVTLRPLLKVSSAGPPADVVDLARWAAHRWHGRLTSVLTSASPSTMVPVRPRSTALRSTAPRSTVPHLPGVVDDLVESAFEQPGVTVVRLGPNDDAAPYLAAAAARGPAIAVVPLVAEAKHLASILRRHGIDTAMLPRDWDAARRGGLALGARSAVWAPVPDLGSIVVVDEHDEGLQDERNPTWNARDIAIERARRLGIPCVLLSPAPSAVGLASAVRVLEASRGAERSSWPVIRVADRRREDPTRAGLFSPALIQLLRSPGRVVCVLNRKGRAQMLACANCGELVKTADGEQLMSERDGELVSPTTDERRPLFCAVCGGTKLKRVRLGIGRAREELAALAGEPVGEVEAGNAPANERILVGTEAVLHQITSAATIAFLDFDQELLAPRYRSAEQAMALLVRAARLVGPRRSAGTILVQTRNPDHRVLDAVVRADLGQFGTDELAVRRSLGFPPFGAIAEVSGASADAFVDQLRGQSDTLVLGPRPDGRYLVRADTPDRLADRLAEVTRPPGRVRVAVDPPRV